MNDDTDESPLNRLYRAGPAALSDSELVSLLTDNLETARDLVRDGLPAFARSDWTTRRGVPKRTAARLTASLELGRRVAATPDSDRQPITDPTSVATQLMARYSHQPQERLGALYLDARHRLIREHEIFIGTVNSAFVSTREVLKFALDYHAAALIVFHNHPSGDPAPSAEDLVFTKRLIDAGKILCVDVLDHLILGFNRFVSLKERGVF